MALPDFDTVMDALLRLAGDGAEHLLREAVEQLAGQFHVTAAERALLLPSGGRRFDNRVHWARLYLSKAGLLEAIARGRFRITAEGRQALTHCQGQISEKFLRSIPEFAAWQCKSSVRRGTKARPPERLGASSPEEEMEWYHRRLEEEVAEELLERARSCSPSVFEQLVVNLLAAMGYGGGSAEEIKEAVTGGSGDEGIDGVIKQDPLGLEAVYVQAKRWRENVGRPVVQAFVGSLEGRHARKGVLITTSNLTENAKRYVDRIEKKVVLIDGDMLSRLMMQYGVGVRETGGYSIKRVDSDFFKNIEG